MQRLQTLFEQFLRERVYVSNITPATREWYECAWKAFSPTLTDRTARAPLITKADLQTFVIALRERGVKPVSCNTWIRALNAFCRWLHEQGETPALVKLAPQRLEKRIIRTHDHSAIREIVTYKPKMFAQRRVHALALTILDTGCRIEELLTAADAWPGALPARSSGDHPVCQATLPSSAVCVNNVTGAPQAICEDKLYSCSTGAGTCSSNGGVYCWRN